MTEKLTRQQRRAIERQKHYKHIIIGSFYESLKPQTTLHPITKKPFFGVVKILTVTHEEVIYVSPYGAKGYMPVERFEDTYKTTSDAEKLWKELEIEGRQVRGQKIRPDELYQQFLERNPQFEEVLKSQEGVNPLEDEENNLVVKQV